jgi:hypothetical protein
METDLTPAVKEIILLAARKLTGYRRRQFQAEMALQYCNGKPRRAEEIFGWGREAVNTGLGELRTGIRCLDNFAARGRHRTEEDHPEIAQQIHALVDPHSQADPQLKTSLGYTRLTATAVHQHLVAQAAGTDQAVPTPRTVSDILNRLGYRLRRVRKITPQKKCPKPTPYSTTCDRSTRPRRSSRKRCESPLTPRRK